jgi:hypothetical protein
MRDDIHKSAPVNRVWKSFLRHCAREADRQERAAASARAALVSDCARELSPGLIKDLKERCTSPKTDLFRENLDGLRAAGQSGSVMDQQLVERVQLRAQQGKVDLNALNEELAGVIGERKDSQRRAIRGHVLKAGGKGAAECNQAVGHSLNQISAPDLARDILENNGKVSRLPKQNRSVSLDEDLRGGG